MITTAIMKFAGTPGREREAAEAWAFELTYYFLRRVGEQPRVSYANGVYTCEGLMTTTHPGDSYPVTEFDKDAYPEANLDFCVSPERRARIRRLYQGPVFGGGE